MNNVGSSLFNAAAQIRRNSSESIFNSVILGWPVGILIDASKGYPTDNNIPATLFVQNNIIAGCAVPVKYAASTLSPTGFDVTTWFNLTSNNNTVFNTNTEAMITAPFNYGNPDFTPLAGSPALSGADFSNANLKTGFQLVTYLGAVNTGDTWWKGWTKFE